MKKWLPVILQALVSAGFLFWIFRRPDFGSEAWQVLAQADAGGLVAGFLLAGAGNLLGVVRWGLFLRLLGIRIPAWEVLRLSFVGLFFNNFLVGAVGGDVVKVVWLSAKGHAKTPALLSVLMDRMSGLGALVVCSLTFMLWRWDWLMRSPVVAGVMQFVVGYLIVVVALLGLSLAMTAAGLARRLPERFPLRARLVEFTDIYLLFATAWRQTAAASVLSAFILVGHFLTFYCSARAFGVQIPLPDFFAFMPAVDIISAMPVSLGGLGVREQLFATVLGDLSGVPEAQAVSISLAGAFLGVVWGLAGLALLPGYRRVTGGKCVQTA